MMNNGVVDELSRRIAELLPGDIRVLQRDLEKNIRAVLHSGFEKLDLVSREEFDVQSRLLERSRARLTELEKRLAELEAHHQG